MYLNSKTYLFGEHGGDSFELQPGEYKYNFNCHLPSQLPYSLLVKHGKIRYFVKAVLDIPWHIDEEAEASFIVIRRDDLNLRHDLGYLKMKQEKSISKTFMSFLSSSEPLHMTAILPYSGFAIGQKVPIRIFYTNKSDVDILRTKIKLVQSILLVAHEPDPKTKQEETTIFEVQKEGVAPKRTNQFDTSFDIPNSTIASNEQLCRVVTLTYFVEIEAVASGLHSNLKLLMPIVIASYPLTFDAEPSAPLPEILDGQQNADLRKIKLIYQHIFWLHSHNLFFSAPSYFETMKTYDS